MPISRARASQPRGSPRGSSRSNPPARQTPPGGGRPPWGRAGGQLGADRARPPDRLGAGAQRAREAARKRLRPNVKALGVRGARELARVGEDEVELRLPREGLELERELVTLPQ